MILIQKALEKAFDLLDDIRFRGLGTHKNGHSIAYLIHKLLNQLINETLVDRDNKFLEFFNQHIASSCEFLHREFDSIFKLFTKELFSKREKELLFRAFYPDFKKVESHILDLDIRLRYFAIYDYCLDRYLDLLKDLPDLSTSDDTNESGECLKQYKQGDTI